MNGDAGNYKFPILVAQHIQIATRTVRILVFFLLLTVPTLATAQYKGLLYESFFSRQPGARTEAMGKASTSIDGDLSTIHFNPAGIASIRGFEINASYTPPSFYLTEGYYTFFGAGIKINDYLRIAVSQFQFNLGKTEMVESSDVPFVKHNTLTIGSEPIKNLYIGLNANLLVYNTGTIGEATSFFLDFGVIKKFEFLQKESSAHSVNMGASVSNFTMSVLNFSDSRYTSVSELPFTGRLGVNYQYSLDKHLIIEKLETLRFLLQGEYQNVLNSEFYSAYRVGGEILIWEILALRAGYYIQEENDFRLPEANYDEITAVTGGIGLQLPLHKLTNLPLNIRFDFTSLPQQPYSMIYTDFENFNTYSLRLNWIFKEKDRSGES